MPCATELAPDVAEVWLMLGQAVHVHYEVQVAKRLAWASSIKQRAIIARQLTLRRMRGMLMSRPQHT